MEPGRRPAGTAFPVELAPAQALTLRLNGWAGDAGTRFLLRLTPVGPEPPGGPFLLSGSLDAAGTWTGTAPPPGLYEVRIEVAGRSFTSERLGVPESGPGEVRLKAPAGVEVRGRLLDAGGAPVEGGRVSFSATEPPPVHLGVAREPGGAAARRGRW